MSLRLLLCRQNSPSTVVRWCPSCRLFGAVGSACGCSSQHYNQFNSSACCQIALFSHPSCVSDVAVAGEGAFLLGYVLPRQKLEDPRDWWEKMPLDMLVDLDETVLRELSSGKIFDHSINSYKHM